MQDRIWGVMGRQKLASRALPPSASGLAGRSIGRDAFAVALAGLPLVVVAGAAWPGLLVATETLPGDGCSECLPPTGSNDRAGSNGSEYDGSIYHGMRQQEWQ